MSFTSDLPEHDCHFQTPLQLAHLVASLNCPLDMNKRVLSNGELIGPKRHPKGKQDLGPRHHLL